MKITVFNGSPKGANSNTNVMTTAFLQGAERAGAETETIFLIEKEIQHCKGCFSCWFRTPGKCVYQDDMAELLEIYKKSDIVCYATPIYLWNMTACLKQFLDRMIPLKSPTVVQNGDRCDMADSGKLPKTIIFSNAGFPGENNFSILHESVKPANPILEIYRNCGMLLRSKEKEMQEKVAEYLAFVEQAGYEVVKDGKISEETKAGLAMEWMPPEEYLHYIMKG